MIKKLISVLLAAAMWTVCILPCLTGCNGGGGDGYTVAEWLDKVEMQFNMLYYNTDEPFFPNVTAESQHFDTLQIAAEWGLVDPAAGIRPDDKITKEFAADTLVSAMAFNYETDAGIADADKISDLNKVSIAVNEGVFTLDGNGRFDPQKKITREEADAAADIAYDKWVNLSYGESFDNSTVKSEVINLGGLASDKAEIAPGTYTVEYSGDLNVIDENGNYADNSTKTITFPAGTNIGVEVGSVLTLPADSQTPTPFAVVVDSITNNPDGTMTVKTHNAELEDVYQVLDTQYSGALDMDDAVVYDMMGNRLSGGATSQNVVYAGGSTVNGLNEEYIRKPLVTEVEEGSGKVPLTDDVSLIFKVKDDSVTLGIEAEIKSGAKKITVGYSEEWGMGVDFKVDDLSFDDLWNGGKFFARLAVDMKKKTEGKFGISTSTDDILDNIIGPDGLSAEELNTLYNAVCGLMDEMTSEFSDKVNGLSAPLLMIIVPTNFGEIQMMINLNLSLSGEIKFSIETKAKYGLEWDYGHLRPIHEFSFTPEFEIEAKAELTLFLGVGWGFFGKSIIDGGVEVGVGGKVNTKIFELDATTDSIVQECAMMTGMFGGVETQVPLALAMADNLRACVDVKAYPIVKIRLCTERSVIGGVFKCGIDIDVMGEDNAFFEKHIESDNGVVSACTRETGDTYNIEEGPAITLNSDTLCLAVGDDSEKLKVRTLPKGYAAKDLVFTVEDSGIADVVNLIEADENETKVGIKFRFFGAEEEFKFSQNTYRKYNADDHTQMRITGNADGVTMLKVSTKDGLYSAECKLLIGNGGIAERVENVFIIEEFSIKLTPGATGEVKVQSAPIGYDMSQVTFTSSDTSVATVSGSGTVTAVGEGQAVITISTTDGAYTAMCMVFVSSAGNSV